MKHTLSPFSEKEDKILQSKVDGPAIHIVLRTSNGWPH